MAVAMTRIVRVVVVTAAILILGLGSVGSDRASATGLPDLVIRVCRIGDGVPYPDDPRSITGGRLIVQVKNVGSTGFGTPNGPFNIHLYTKYASYRQTFFSSLTIRAAGAFTADKVYFLNGQFSFPNCVPESNETNNEFRFNYYSEVPAC